MSWKSQLRNDSLPWLLESENPGVRYLALRDLSDLSPDDKKLKAARKSAHKEGPIAHILSKMNEEGYWQRPGTGYGPKYKSTVWALILLAQLGASVKEDKRIKLACKYYLDHALNPGGQISAMTNAAPSGTVDCLQGNMLWSLMTLGYNDPRMDLAYESMARTTTGEGVAPMKEKHAPVRYFAGKCGPTFACGANNKLPKIEVNNETYVYNKNTFNKYKNNGYIRKIEQSGMIFFSIQDIIDYDGYSIKQSRKVPFTIEKDNKEIAQDIMLIS